MERVADFDVVEKALRSRIQKQLLPDAKVELVFERHFLPLELRPVSQALAAHAQAIYGEIGGRSRSSNAQPAAGPTHRMRP